MLVTQQSTGPITTICVSPPNLGINCVPGLIELFSLVAGWLADGISPDHSSLYPAIVGPVVIVYPGNGYKLNDATTATKEDVTDNGQRESLLM